MSWGTRADGATRWCLAALLLAGCGGRAVPPGPRNVVLVTIDTLRADHLGVYGYARATSPAIDALARESTVFESALATCTSTGPATASLLTGTHRAWHRVLANGWVLADRVQTLAEVLQAHGYRTAARIANATLGADLGFAQGFDDFAMPAALLQEGPGQFGGAPLVAEVEPLVQKLGAGPFFLWLHFMDPHGPYFPPPEYQARFSPDDYRWPDEHDLPISTSNFGLGVIPAYQRVERRAAPADYRARYDAEIRYVDDHVAAVVRVLRAHGLLDGAIVVLAADHGESLGEHRYYFQHGWFLSDEMLRVPLLVRGPGVPAGRRVRASVSTVDVAPTVLDLVGLPPVADMEGRSLRPLLDADGPDREAFAQTYYGEGLVALRTGQWSYVFKQPRTDTSPRTPSEPPLPDAATEELFDVATDPGEVTNVVAAQPDVARRMRQRVEDWLGQQERRARGSLARSPGQGLRLGDPQLEHQLRALGYVD